MGSNYMYAQIFILSAVLSSCAAKSSDEMEKISEEVFKHQENLEIDFKPSKMQDPGLMRK